MKKITFFLVLLSSMGWAQVEKQSEEAQQKEIKQEKEPHKYGGWYCPDNLKGFPPVDIGNWESVPVIGDRLPTKEETQTEASLIYIDKAEYPDAKAMDIKLPKLATYYCKFSKKKEHVIVIQAIEVDGDSVVGFRFLNGGNGSAYFSEVNFLSDQDAAGIPVSRFVSIDTKIMATQDAIWKIMTGVKLLNVLYPTFRGNVPATNDWRTKATANYKYASPTDLTSHFADKLYGCFYVQNDYLIKDNPFVEKFLLIENEEENYTELKIVCGPYQNDFEAQQTILQRWAEKIKELSEQGKFKNFKNPMDEL